MSTPTDLPPPDAAPVRGVPGCKLCGEYGYVTEQQGAFAVARICSCVPVCPRCQGTGRITVLQGGVPVTGRCRCQQLPDRIERFNFARIPARHYRSTFASFSQGASTHDPEKMQPFMQIMHWKAGFFPGKVGGLLLHGPVGRGKTHLLVSLLRDLVFEQGVPVRYVEFSRLLSELKEGYDRGQGDTTLLAELASVEVLAIDELGKGRVTDWERSIVDEIVSRRYNAMRCTLGATNYDPAPARGVVNENLADDSRIRPSLGDRVGDRVQSRLTEMCDAVLVGGIDMRARMEHG